MTIFDYPKKDGEEGLFILWIILLQKKNWFINPQTKNQFTHFSEHCLSQSFSPPIIPAPTVMLSRYTSGLFQHPAITLSNLLRQSFSPPIIPASTVIPASSVIPANAGISLDVRSLPEGTYLLQIKDRNKSILKTERTVIVRWYCPLLSAHLKQKE